MSWQEYLIPGTNLVDYGPAMDGFSPTYKHVMPGCSQGNTVWMLRDFASFREAQGRSEEAGRLRKLAQGLSDDTMHKMYTADEDGKGFFNIIFPPDGVASLREAEPDAASPEAAKQLTVMEMRHVVGANPHAHRPHALGCLCCASDPACMAADRLLLRDVRSLRDHPAAVSHLRLLAVSAARARGLVSKRERHIHLDPGDLAQVQLLSQVADPAHGRPRVRACTGGIRRGGGGVASLSDLCRRPT